MRRPSPAPAPLPAPPPRRAGAPGPPPRRTSAPAEAPGRATPPRRPGPPTGARTGPRPAPPRPPGPPRRRRGPVLIAAAITLVVLLGYGGYSAWNAVTGGGSGGGDAPAARSYESIVLNDIFLAGQVVGHGVDVRLMGDLNAFRDAADRAIYIIGLDMNALDGLESGATGPQRDVIASTRQSLDALQVGLIQWRDAVYNLRLASVDDAHSAIDSAVARLQSDLDEWRTLPAES